MADQRFDDASAFFFALQDRIVHALEALEPEARFLRDPWTRDEDAAAEGSPVLGGHGRTCVLDGGHVFEKAGVAFSRVHGRFSPEFAEKLPGSGLEFHATGISLVLHPRNPFVPTVHMNYRRLSRPSGGWFGGGADLTPNYLFPDDARHFHQVHADACDRHPEVASYDAFKAQCDAYFHLPHRGETRGVGGIFFDYRSDHPDATFAFVRDAGDAFVDAYVPIVRRRMDLPWTDAHRDWQLLRRGRYVEFNLIWDRGTTFGLRTGGRTESILMSLPAEARWRYDHRPAPGSPEDDLQRHLRPIDWLGRAGGEVR